VGEMGREEEEGNDMERVDERAKEREEEWGGVGERKRERAREIHVRDTFKVHLVKQVPVFHAADDHIGKQVLNVVNTLIVNTLIRFVNSV
jgi:hypothetical protein